MEEILQEFQTWMKKHDMSKNTELRYMTVAKQFVHWYQQDTSSSFNPSLVDHEDIIRWRNIQLTKRGGTRKYKVSTVVNKVESLKTFFRYLKDNGSINSDPMQDLKPLKYSPDRASIDPKWLRKDEVQLFKDYIESKEIRFLDKWSFYRNRAVAYLMLFAGLRVSEVSNLEMEDIFPKSIHVRNSKGNKSRDVPINSDLRYFLSAWLDMREQKVYEHDFLFVSKRGNGLSVSGIEFLFSKMREETGIKRLTPHTLRHTFCKTLYDLTKDLDLVANLAGHSDLDTTRIYVSSSQEEEGNALEKLASGHFREEEIDK